MRVHHYHSVADLCAEQVSFVNQNHSYVKDRFGIRRGDTWYGRGVSTVQQIEDTVAHGWPEGLTRINTILRGMGHVPQVRSVRRRKMQTDFGDSLDIQKVYAGQLDTAWTRAARAEGKQALGPHTVLLVNVDGHAALRSDSLFWRGAVATHLTDLLIASGRNVEIISYTVATNCYAEDPWGTKTLTAVKVKKFMECADMERIAATTAYTPFLRYYLFRVMLAQNVRVVEGLGRPDYEYTPTAADLDLPEGTGIIHVRNVWDEQAAKKLIDEVTASVL